MASPYRWLDERIGLAQLKHVYLDREIPDRLTWWHTLGSATLAVFLVQVVTGLVLATYYSASPAHAYESITYLQEEVAGGVLLRGIHYWAASAMVILVMAHLIRVFVTGAYKYPREANWLLGVGLFLLVLGFGFTGYLLPWDQKAYWATQVGTSMIGTTPGVGDILVRLVRGGTAVGAATLARFYAFHVLWLPALLGLFILLHLGLVVRQGIAARPRPLEEGAPTRTSDPEYPSYYRDAYAASKRGGVRFWPDAIAKDVFVSTVVIGVILVLAIVFGAELELPADPTDTSYVPVPEWYFLPIYQLLKLVPGTMEATIAVGVPTALIIGLFALPFFDRGSRRNLVRRPFALASLAFLLGGSGWLVGAALRDASTIDSVPVAVGRPLTSIERAGLAIYRAQNCASCHTINGDGGTLGPDISEIGLRHSIGWMHSYIETPDLFKPNSLMPAYLYPVLTHQEVEELSHFLASLRGGAGPEVEPVFQDSVPFAR